MSFGIMEILLVFGIVVFFFGAKRIPQIARGVGEGIRNFRHSIKEGSEDQGQLEDGEDGDRRLDDRQDR
ncbi:MAG: twin-arginine translocase TatA/TatE family subunit [Gemmatimonadota bacterium]